VIEGTVARFCGVTPHMRRSRLAPHSLQDRVMLQLGDSCAPFDRPIHSDSGWLLHNGRRLYHLLSSQAPRVKKFDFGQTIQIVANIGVLAGLIFLAVEVSQNQSSIDEDAQLNTLESFNEFRNFIANSEQLSEIWLKGLAGNELTPTEALRFGYICLDYLMLFATNYSRFETQSRAT